MFAVAEMFYADAFGCGDRLETLELLVRNVVLEMKSQPKLRHQCGMHTGVDHIGGIPFHGGQPALDQYTTGIMPAAEDAEALPYLVPTGRVEIVIVRNNHFNVVLTVLDERLNVHIHPQDPGFANPSRKP